MLTNENQINIKIIYHRIWDYSRCNPSRMKAQSLVCSSNQSINQGPKPILLISFTRQMDLVSGGPATREIRYYLKVKIISHAI
jgi:hypothetical protein